MGYDLLLLEREGPVATVTLNRPEKRNALNAALRAEIAAVIEEIDADDEIRVAIVTGAGPAFCAGFDLSEFDTANATEHFASDPQNPLRFHEVLGSFSKPLVGAINGPALAGGFDVAAQCDVRIASQRASFGHPEIKFAPVLVTQLTYIVGGAVARDLTFSGRRIDAAEAHRVGLVSAVVEPELLMPEARAYANTVAESPREVLQAVKRTLNERMPFRAF